MTNQEIAKILYEISEYLEMQDVQFKPRAYEKAAHSIEALEESIFHIYEQKGIKGLDQIPAVGKGMAEKIEELIKTGHLKYYEKLKKKMPVNVKELTAIEGIGPKMVKSLYKHLKIKNIEDLEKAAKAGKIRELEGFGEKTEENILKGIDFLKKSKGRFVLGFIIPQVREVEQKIKNFKGVGKAIVGGSIRRKKETIGDCDLLVTVSSDKAAKQVSDFFVNMPEVVHIYNHGKTRCSVKLNNGMDFDLRIVPEKSFGSALQYFTGNKAHNIALRKIAIKKGLKLNEYGLFRNKKQIAGKTEQEIYQELGLKWMDPELRTNHGEIKAAQKNKLPDIIGYDDLKGDLQIQTTWSDGSNSIEDYVNQAKKIGLEYIVITDHTKSLAMANGLDEKRLAEQGRQIDKINKKLTDFRVLKGSEVDILKDGKLDLKDETLKKLDVVGIAAHSNFKSSKKKMTERIIRAMKNPHADILFHPTGRVINRRPAYELDIERIIKAAKQTGTILEINAYPNRLDLKDEYARMAKEHGVKLSIDSDAHSITHLYYLEFGIAQARRGWITKKDVVNTRSVKQFLKLLKR
ncbi:MAG: DNA polymerase/3'-5' exonuclease PolX [Atribacterota bacterium]